MDNAATTILQHAYELIKSGRPQEALPLLNDVLRANPDNAAAWYLLAHALAGPEKKLYAYRQVLRLDPSNAAAQKQIARLAGQTAASAGPAPKPSAPKKRAARLLLLVAAGGLILLVAVFAAGVLMLQPGGFLAAGAAPTALLRHPGLPATLAPLPSSIASPLPSHTPSPSATPTPTAFPTALVRPAPTVAVAPNLAVFTSKETYWEAGIAWTERQAGHLQAGESVAVSLDVDSATATAFNLLWGGQKPPVFTLTDPHGRTIDEAYATAHPEEVSLSTNPYLSITAYQFTKALPGRWTINLKASAAGDYGVFGSFGPDGLVLSMATDTLTYFPGDIVTIGARLEEKGAGLAGASLVARVQLPENIIETVPLTDLGDGRYVAAYQVPPDTQVGYASADVTAKGSRDGVNFNRQAFDLLQIAPDTIKLTGAYHETPRDEDGDGKYEQLDLSVGLNLTAPGEYDIQANLYAGEHFIGPGGKDMDLPSGAQTVNLSFNGTMIAESGLDGPYTVDLFVTDMHTGITAQRSDKVFATAAYRHSQFGKVSYTISGNTGRPGVRLDYVAEGGQSGPAYSDDAGNYSIVVPYHWSGKITPYEMAYTFTPGSRTYTELESDQRRQDYTVVATMYTVKGNTGLGGVTLTYTTKDGVSKKIKSDSHGDYTLTLPFNWEGSVTPTLAGHAFRPDHISYELFGDQTGEDFTPVRTISGNAGLAGVRLDYDDDGPRGTMSKPDGSYSLTVSENWSGTITPTLDGYRFTPASRSYTGVLTDLAGQDYTAAPLAAATATPQ